MSTNEKAPAASTAPALLTTRETADALRVHPRTVQRMVERGQLRVVHSVRLFASIPPISRISPSASSTEDQD